ncbi:MAG TPA: SMC family ATPase, partial [Gemmatimonadaceae bacterium]|nr:SMC family ATPase [Gemmatimonadaceae bacterium]
MRLNSLHLQNFRQHLDTRIEFDSGLTGIIGPNGAGKSTILEAIAWALYGMPAARGTRDSIRAIRAGARASVRVELDFDLGGHRYRVVRGLTSAELFLDGGDQPIANSLTGVTDMLRRRLGMSLDEFFNTYFTGQKELSVMAAMGPSERAQFLSRVLGYERLRAAQALVRDRRKLIGAEAQGVRAAMPDPDVVMRMKQEAAQRLASASSRAEDAVARRERARTQLEALGPEWQRAQQEREQLQATVAELRVAEADESNATRDVERLGREVGELDAARAELTELTSQLAPLGPALTELRAQDNLCREEGRRQTLTESERSLAEDVARLNERREKVSAAPALEAETTMGLAAARQALREVEEQLELRRTEWVRDRQEAETKTEALREQYAELKQQRDQLAVLGAESPCPTCTRPLGATYTTVLEDLDSRLETVRVDGKYYKTRREQLDAMPEDLTALEERRRAATEEAARLERRLTRVQLGVQELAMLGKDLEAKQQRLDAVRRDLAAIPAGYDAARHVELQALVARLQPLDARAARISAQIEREGQLRTEHRRALERQVVARDRAAALRARRDAAAFSEERFAELRQRHDLAATELRAAELNAAAAQAEAASARHAEENALRAEQDLARAQAQLDVLTRDRRLHDELDRAYTDMRTDLNVQLRPEISEVASVFLRDLTDGRYSELELDDQYNIVVLEDGIPKPVISGGEEDLANLVLRLAISQMIADRAGTSFSLLILDEVFGSLDESRRQNVVDLLRQLHDRFEQVVLITHIDGVREGLDRVVTVRYDAEAGSA